MKLFIIAALTAVAAAGRLEHLERSYLPPDQGNKGSFGSSGSSFGSHGNGASGFGSSGLGSHGGFGSSGSLGSGSFGSNGFGAAAGRSGSSAFHPGSYPGATINQYLPPNHEQSTGFNGLPKFGSPAQGFGLAQAPQASQYSSSQKYSAPSSQYGTPQFGSSASNGQGHGGSSFGSHTGSSFGSHAGSSLGSHSGSSVGSQAGGSFGSHSRYQPNSATSRQYLAPKDNFQNIPQQSFDDETGYHY